MTRSQLPKEVEDFPHIMRSTFMDIMYRDMEDTSLRSITRSTEVLNTTKPVRLK